MVDSSVFVPTPKAIQYSMNTYPLCDSFLPQKFENVRPYSIYSFENAAPL